VSEVLVGRLTEDRRDGEETEEGDDADRPEERLRAVHHHTVVAGRDGHAAEDASGGEHHEEAGGEQDERVDVGRDHLEPADQLEADERADHDAACAGALWLSEWK
jgi:hypothetical protein